MSVTEIKGQLARLLATENLVVEHRKCETASFDVDRRILTLPIWQNLENVVYDLLVGHEVGHALYTPPTVDAAVSEELPKSYVNVTEDARIEKLMKRKFPGLAKSFYNGYKSLHARDFFGVWNEDIAQMKLIDRINLHCKIGAVAMIPFDDEEEEYVELVELAETFEDAVAAAQVIWDLEQYNREQNSAPSPKTDIPNPNQAGSTPDDDQEFEVPQQPERGEDPQKSKPEEQEKADLDTPSYQTGGGKQSDEAVTDTAFEENLKKSASQDEHSAPRYLEIADPDLENLIVDHKYVAEQLRIFWSECDGDHFLQMREEEDRKPDFTHVDLDYKKFVDSNTREVNYLVKEFEMKKSATAYARQTVSKTGILDMKKLHAYNWSEDLFLKVTNTPDGKNHGLIFMLDWSGSMAPYIHDTVKQLLSLTAFCKKVGIPFEVYSFVYDPTWNALQYEYPDQAPEHTEQTPDTYYFPKEYRLINLLSSRTNAKEYDTECKNLYRVSYWFGKRELSYWEFQAFKTYPMPGFFGLGGTPLNDAIASLPALIPHFRAKTGVEKTNVVFLTDGESNQAMYWDHSSGTYNDGRHWDRTFQRAVRNNHCLRNRRNGRVYPELQGWWTATQRLLEYVRDTFSDVNIVGFRVCQPREANRLIRYYSGWDDAERVTADFKRNKTAIVRDCGYDELYLIAASNLDSDVEFEVKEDATKAQIRSAFKKTLKAKASNKKILSSFIGQIA